MRTCGYRTARGVVAATLAVALAGCGGGGRAEPPAAKRLTIAEVCRQHKTATATIVGGLVDYKTYMTAADPAFRRTFARSEIAKRVAPAIRTLKDAAKPVPSAGAGRKFFDDLDSLEGWLRSPAAVPSAVVGDHNASKIEDAAKAVGCTL